WHLLADHTCCLIEYRYNRNLSHSLHLFQGVPWLFLFHLYQYISKTTGMPLCNDERIFLLYPHTVVAPYLSLHFLPAAPPDWSVYPPLHFRYLFVRFAVYF